MAPRRIVLALAVTLSAGCLGEITSGPGTAPPNADPQAGCSIGCHGDSNSVAPPTSLAGDTATTATGVGAHRVHLDPASTWHRKVACADCHAVPDDVGSPGHMDDGDRKAELTFSQVAGPSTTWNGTSCTTWCHGSAAFGATAPTPTWTVVDGSQSTCGSCHGAPPAAPHPQDSNCASCHPTMEEGSLSFRDPSSHINGIVDVVGAGAGGCTSCHGSVNSAPPRDLSGDTAPTIAGVGAHQAHLGTSTWHREVSCASCHTVPTSVDAPGHRDDGDNLAELTFDTLNPAGTYNRAAATCANQYCHGNGQGNNGTVAWTTPGALGCTSCHATNGTGMSGEHRKHINGENMRCSECHADVVNANQTILNANLHVNGVHEVKMAAGTYNPMTRACSNTGCHGTERW